MIELIHKYPILIKTLLAITTFAFVATGGFLYMGDQSGEDWVAKVEGEAIPVSEYQQLVMKYEDFYRDLYQGEIPPEMRAQLRLEETAMNELINRRVILFSLDDLGITVGDRQVSDTIVSNPNFQGEDGRFDKARYIELLGMYDLTPKSYEESVRRDLAVSMFRNMVRESAVVSDDEALMIFKDQMAAIGVEFDQAKFDEQKDSLKSNIADRKENAMIASMMADLRKNFEIEENPVYAGKEDSKPGAPPAPTDAEQPQQGEPTGAPAEG